ISIDIHYYIIIIIGQLITYSLIRDWIERWTSPEQLHTGIVSSLFGLVAPYLQASSDNTQSTEIIEIISKSVNAHSYLLLFLNKNCNDARSSTKLASSKLNDIAFDLFTLF